jgi:hypothetical protein
MRAADPAAALRLLIAALPEDRLRALLLELLLGSLPAGAATPERSVPRVAGVGGHAANQAGHAGRALIESAPLTAAS